MKDIETHTLRQFRGALAELAQQHFDDPVLSITLRRHLQGALKVIDQIISTSCQSDVTKAKGHTPKA